MYRTTSATSSSTTTTTTSSSKWTTIGLDLTRRKGRRTVSGGGTALLLIVLPVNRAEFEETAWKINPGARNSLSIYSTTTPSRYPGTPYLAMQVRNSSQAESSRFFESRSLPGYPGTRNVRPEVPG
eukprot:1258205-Rhodomonas_salina.2